MDKQEQSDRLIEAAAVLLQSSPGHELNIVVLNKALFYSDLRCLRDYGETFTDNTYLALKQGPVVAKYDKRLVRVLEQCGIAVQKEFNNAKPLALQKMPKLTHCVGELLKTIQEVGTYFSKLGSGQVSKISHLNLGWKIAWDKGGKANGRMLPIDMNLAMQQIADSDEWLNENLTESEQESIELVEPGVGVEW